MATGQADVRCDTAEKSQMWLRDLGSERLRRASEDKVCPLSVMMVGSGIVTVHNSDFSKLLLNGN